MVNAKDLLETDRHHIWPPCTALKPAEPIPRLIVNRAEGSWLYTNQGPVIDAISSWWCKSLGHAPEPVIQAIQKQLTQFEHVIGANATYPGIIDLSEQLADITGKQHVFFASDGSCAVEIALKLVLHAMQLKHQSDKTHFIALEHGYHGETVAALSVSDVSCYKKPFEGLGLSCHVLRDLPYVSGEDDPMWDDCSEVWPAIESQLESFKHNSCGLILEPIVQGAGGMRVYSADFLKRLYAWTRTNNIYLIADEIMTGLGRTGRWLASEHADISPDLVCLSKGLTAGTMPLSCVLIDSKIYDVFYENNHEPFLHSHTYSGHALGVAAALATIQVITDREINTKACELGIYMKQCFIELANASGALTNIRAIGGMVAGDLNAPPGINWGPKLARVALEYGILLRPLGNTVYWFPPLTTDKNTIDELAEKTQLALKKVINLH
ncbi:MAG: adenosylmethionine--8-amino-7-oxononanoate transaminase [Legionellaceae bacterium]|nr:adenosylmethionine--8-amino-7-oxononanoate transaminase [Legionellaceae bacterium]